MITTETINLSVPAPALLAASNRTSPAGFSCGKRCATALRKFVDASCQKS